MVLVFMKKRELQGTFGFVNWGGKRRGAGRKPKGERAGVTHTKRPRLAERFPVHVTMRLREGLRSLRYKDEHAILLQVFAAASNENFRVVEYGVQSNHAHLLVESRDERALTRGMIGLTVRVARRLNKLWNRAGSVFADRYHSRILRTPREVRNALVYVLQNARKHNSWRAPKPDVYSSGSSFDGWRASGNLAESSPRLLQRARTWLLSIGWKRHGLIELGEQPREERPKQLRNRRPLTAAG